MQDAPYFSTPDEDVMSGDEAEFEECKKFQHEYIKSRGGKIEIITYAYSSKWGHVARSVYSFVRIPDIEAGEFQEITCRASFICWIKQRTNELHFVEAFLGPADVANT
jgi:hypothetical protein